VLGRYWIPARSSDAAVSAVGGLPGRRDRHGLLRRDQIRPLLNDPSAMDRIFASDAATSES
jgi:hypothetical protein